MGRTGHWPVPAGDSPAGREGRQRTLWWIPSATVPGGESPPGTGESPVLPIFNCIVPVQCESSFRKASGSDVGGVQVWPVQM